MKMENEGRNGENTLREAQHVRLVLVEPQHEENLAAILRSSLAFGITDIWLVNPKLRLDRVEERIARKGIRLLKTLRITNTLDEAIRACELVLAGSAKDATSQNILRDYATPREALRKAMHATSIALLFGREDTGLREEELELADILYTIPTRAEQRALNLAHAVSIILYELAMTRTAEDAFKRIPRATREEKERLLAHVLSIVSMLNEDHPNARARLHVQKLVWQRILGTADMTRIDLNTLFGFFTSLHERLERATRRDAHDDAPGARGTSKSSE